MIKKFTKFLVIFAMLANISAKADEGMWLMMLIERLNYVDMQKKGLHLSPEEIYSVNNSSLKDAIVKFDKGCSAEMISDQGLLLTAHHCGFDYIQMNSTIDKDILKTGFFASSRAEELPCPGLEVSYLIKVEDVTDRVLNGITDNMTETSRKNKIDAATLLLVDNATKKTSYTAEVKSFFEGKEYYMFTYQTFKDVRFVGAPPACIGNFGGDTDNWSWPRHNGDFSMFRVYSAADGSPAPYSKDNIAYKPKHFLPISLKGVKEGDFAMTIGFPSKTDRFISSYGVKLAETVNNPSIVKIRDKKLSIMKENMAVSKEAYLKLIAKYMNTSNYWKFFQEQTQNIRSLKIYDKKKSEEETFQKWADKDAVTKAKYGTVVKDFADAYQTIDKFYKAKIYYTEIISRGTDILGLAKQYVPLYQKMSTIAKGSEKKKLMEEANQMAEGLKEQFREYVRSADYKTDKKILCELLKYHNADIAKEQLPDIFQVIEKDFNGNIDIFTDNIFSTSIFADPEKMWYFLNHPDEKVLEKDMAFKLLTSFNRQNETIEGAMLEANWKVAKAKRLYIEGEKEMNASKKFYSDANGTMRLSYGKVAGYVPADGLIAEYRTTLKGVMEKENKTDEFVVPEKLKFIDQYKDFGKYSENDVMPVCFITTNDITGGSSGCPVINADGSLVGIVFDLNREAMSADLSYNVNLQRTICVDIRYPLMIMEKMYKANYVLKELKFNE